MNITDLLVKDTKTWNVDDVFWSPENKELLQNFIKEHKYWEELKKYNLPVDNKILLYGATGCGKTTSAKAIAQALGMEIAIVNLSNLVNSRIGETGKNLKTIFDKARWGRVVLFLDEFDSIAKMRGSEETDVGEMRRLVNSMIQLIDYFPEKSILIAATNFVELIDPAVMRRFQLKLKFNLPSKQELDHYYDALLEKFPENIRKIERKYSISYAEGKDYVHTAVKRLLIKNLENT